MRKKMLFLSCLAAFAYCAFAAPAPSAWTVLIYMAADNDLEESAISDLEEMMASGAGSAFNLLVLADRGSVYTTSGVGGLTAWAGAKLLSVEGGKLKQVADWGEVDMGSSQTLSRFVASGLAMKPATHNALFFWDHGGAWQGFGVDESMKNSTLTIPELQEGLDSGLAKAGLAKLDLVGFDACLMADFETMAALKSCASYYLGSEELEPGHGWDYRSLSCLGTSTGPVEVGKALMAGYMKQSEAEKDRDQVTISLVDLGRFPALETAVRAFSQAAQDDIGIVAGGLGRVAGTALAYGKAGKPSQDSHMVDIGSLADAVAQENSALSEQTASVRAALAKAVVAVESGSLLKGSSGISIYFPNQKKLYDATYEAKGNGTWRGLLVSYYSQGSGKPKAEEPRFDAKDNLASVDFDEEGLTIKGRLAKGCAAGVVDSVVYFGTVDDDGSIVFVGDDDASLDIASGQVEGFWDRTILKLKQGKRETYGYLSLSAQEDGNTLYSIPFAYFKNGKITDDYEYAYMDLVVDDKDEEVSSSLFKENDAGMTAELRPTKGSKLVPLVEVLGEDGESTMEMTEDWGFDARDWESIEMDYEELEAGTPIYMELQAADAADNSDYVYFDGEME